MSLTLGEKVQRVREKMGWSRKELADRAGLHPSHIGLIERGGRTEVRPTTVSRLADALGVPLLYLLVEDPIAYAQQYVVDLANDEERASELTAGLVAHEVASKYGPESAEIVLASADIRDLVRHVTLQARVRRYGGSDDLAVPGPYGEALALAMQNNLTGHELLLAVQFAVRMKQSNMPAKS